MTTKISKNQPKTIKMNINVQGIEENRLNFQFRLEVSNNLSLCFRPRLVANSKLEIYIPALGSLISNLEGGRYTASLEINDGEKYFMKPWVGEVVVEDEPKVDVSLSEDEELNSSNIEVNEYKDTELSVKANLAESKKEINKKTMTKEEAIKFIKETKNRLKNENQELVDKFISNKLRENGFKYNPEVLKQKKKSSKTKKQQPKETINEVRSEKDIVRFLNSKGLRNENTISTLMENLKSKCGNDLDSMFDMAKRMVDPQHQQFENTTDIYNQFYQQAMGNYQMAGGDQQEFGQPSEQGQSSLMEQIQKAKADLHSQLNVNINKES